MIRALLGILSGFGAGVLSGAFGVGGAIVTTPAVQVLLGARPLIAVGTPLPAIFPTSLAGLHAYWKADLIDWRAVRWAALPGMLGAAGGALLTTIISPHLLLLATAVLIGYQALRVGFFPKVRTAEFDPPPAARASLAATGLAAGLASGLLGIGGGVVMVPIMSGLLGMPLKRAVATSLAVITALVIPGTIVHAALGHIDWLIVLWLSTGSVLGAAVGSRWTVRSSERTLRMVTGAFLLTVSVAYGGLEIHHLLAG
ncbi:MAG TPA: hypothetical protein DIT48_13090 [Actinobacteria bacterium]|nr:hypothetical protein [Actinomycetota bacterium]HCP62657.1 hypothetical protein [Actinomycetota bacterium]